MPKLAYRRLFVVTIILYTAIKFLPIIEALNWRAIRFAFFSTDSKFVKNMAFSTDVALLSKLCCQNAGESDWQNFYQKYQNLIRIWCRQSGVQQSDFEDVFHDILIKLVVSLPNYKKTDAKFRSWLKTIVVNALVDRIRNADKSPFPRVMSDSNLEANNAAVNEHDEAIELLAKQLTEKTTPAAEILDRARRRVNESTWNIFVRREILAEPVEDIANEYSMKKASVYQSISRLRSVIKKESEDYFSRPPSS